MIVMILFGNYYREMDCQIFFEGEYCERILNGYKGLNILHTYITLV